MRTLKPVLGLVAMLVASAMALSIAPRPSLHPARGAIYFWQTTWTKAASAQRLDGIDRLYLRFFDVAVEAGGARAVPVAPVEFAAPVPAHLAVVPVVYIANAVLRLPNQDLQALADRISTKVTAIAARRGISFDELQIDCDWTDSTRDAYFTLLEEIRRRDLRTVLSATIRLHQVKYRERTGVPPVDRGMLMFYNMGAIGARDDAASSIFNTEDAERYVAWVDDYPLPLDVSLPMFSWAIHRRHGEVIGLIEGVEEAEFAASEWFQPAGVGTYTAPAAAFVRGRYFQAGDAVRFETTTPAVTRAAAELVARHQPARGSFSTVAFFDLNTRTLARYDDAFFRQTLAVFE